MTIPPTPPARGPDTHGPARAGRSARLADLVGPAAAERTQLRRAADVLAHAEAVGKSPAATVASVVLALHVPELTARRLIAGLGLDDAVRKLRELATYPRADPPGLPLEELARWEAGEERVRPRFLSAVCGLYHVGPGELGYRDYTPPADS